LAKWKTASEDLAVESDEEDDETRRERQMLDWVQKQHGDQNNPNFVPVKKNIL
jgi:hypothetical protein